jgi:hypothetical protein
MKSDSGCIAGGRDCIIISQQHQSCLERWLGRFGVPGHSRQQVLLEFRTMKRLLHNWRSMSKQEGEDIDVYYSLKMP